MDETEDSAAAMAAAMGFSSFGAQKPNKRRKFNPNTDAFVASNSTSTLPLHRHDDSNTAPTGSNMVPLGTRNQNKDEINLDDDEDEEHLPPGAQTAEQTMRDDNDDDDPEPQYLDTSRPSAPLGVDPTDDLQSKIDVIVGGPGEKYPLPQPSSSSVFDGGHSSRGDRGGHQRAFGRDSRSGDMWWEDYYDPRFIVNPWDKLEKANGLEPRGAWISWEEAKAAGQA
ncbi:hypothetical protein SAMD00023353_1600790 [Rosellinia necatrix]|uniref:Uncharacterized protein n=1 Tax=Rosellinia necatrix TaxID=77044 RepID=A0A1W2TID0_ROSNE|nr:hypothetical protein SAMD00023353_1600790 [Rosellinia necatrix]